MISMCAPFFFRNEEVVSKMPEYGFINHFFSRGKVITGKDQFFSKDLSSVRGTVDASTGEDWNVRITLELIEINPLA